MKFETAEEVAIVLLRTFKELDQLATTIRAGTSEEEFADYGRAVAHAIGNLDYQILAKIYREHPELEKRDTGLHPPEMNAN
jgi:hypothetical protein